MQTAPSPASAPLFDQVLSDMAPRPGQEDPGLGWAVWMGGKMAETLANVAFCDIRHARKLYYPWALARGNTMSFYEKVLLLAILLTPQESESLVPEKQTPVNLTIKVESRQTRDHWVAEARREGSTITRVVTEFLTARYGKPRG